MDAAFHQEAEAGAWGFIARDEMGNFIAAAAGKLEHIRSPLQAELSACMMAIDGAADLGAQRVVFESDCLTMINALNGREYDAAELGVLFREARSLCRLSFESYDFKFCRRGCNLIAHNLAQFGLGAVVSLSVWDVEAPDFVSALVGTEMVHQV
ncbi:uncharacterized protein [Aegilops tauschii subsp. strangulata]|uniref:uncharacterized protein n=1 Tax=Aegilops tauschii subsp. strangulata TaxID=200361 RepID=UPI003CC86EF0